MRIRHNTTPFEVGDRVRLIERNSIRLREGELGAIASVDGRRFGSPDADLVTVRWDDGAEGTYWPEQLLHDLQGSPDARTDANLRGVFR